MLKLNTDLKEQNVRYFTQKNEAKIFFSPSCTINPYNLLNMYLFYLCFYDWGWLEIRFFKSCWVIFDFNWLKNVFFNI